MVSSCAYDPFAYAPQGSGTATYSVSYGASDGYYDEYNDSNVAVPVAIGLTLVATSSQYWGYDPYRYCYYDYRQSCYYDPWLDCYYPHGYRPKPIYGTPHPYGWHPGHGVCPYPHHPHQRWVDRRYDRLQHMKASHYAWAQKVRYNREPWAAHMRQTRDPAPMETPPASRSMPDASQTPPAPATTHAPPQPNSTTTTGGRNSVAGSTHR